MLVKDLLEVVNESTIMTHYIFTTKYHFNKYRDSAVIFGDMIVSEGFEPALEYLKNCEIEQILEPCMFGLPVCIKIDNRKFTILHKKILKHMDCINDIIRFIHGGNFNKYDIAMEKLKKDLQNWINKYMKGK